MPLRYVFKVCPTSRRPWEFVLEEDVYPTDARWRMKLRASEILKFRALYTTRLHAWVSAVSVIGHRWVIHIYRTSGDLHLTNHSLACAVNCVGFPRRRGCLCSELCRGVWWLVTYESYLYIGNQVTYVWPITSLVCAVNCVGISRLCGRLCNELCWGSWWLVTYES